MLLSVMAGPDPGAPLSIEQSPAQFTEALKRDFYGTRLGWLGNIGGHLPIEPGIMELCQQSFKAFESIGCKVEEASLNFPPNRLWECWVVLRHWYVGADLLDLYNDPVKRQKLKPEAQWEVEGDLKLSATDVSKAALARADWYRALLQLFHTYDYMLLPGVQVFPFDINEHWPKEIAGVKMDTYHRWMEVMIPGTLSGCPVINVPVGFNDKGLPMGVQIIGKNHADLAVLQLAYAYEQATNWVHGHLPPLLRQA
jgi:amidase